MRSHLLFISLACCILATWCCEPNEYNYGCKITGATCRCVYGCRTEYIYKTRKECRDASKAMQQSAAVPPLQPWSTNICTSLPCLRGYCLQTINEPSGYTCKCEGTGYYGRRCEKACPIVQMPDVVFPHECVVI